MECDVGLNIPGELGDAIRQACEQRVRDALSRLMEERQTPTRIQVYSHTDHSHSYVTIRILYPRTELWITVVKLIRMTVVECLNGHYDVHLLDQHTGSPINLRIAA